MEEQEQAGPVAGPPDDEDLGGHRENNTEEQDDSADDENGSVGSKQNEPVYEAYNNLKFLRVCAVLESNYRASKGLIRGRTVTRQERLDLLMKPEFLKTKFKGQSAYPYLRLFLPDDDSARKFAIKDRKILGMYAEALGLSKTNLPYKMMASFQNPEVLRQDPNFPQNTGIVGDLSRVVEYVMYSTSYSSKYPEYYTSDKRGAMPDGNKKITVGEVNDLLDELAKINSPSSSATNHDWNRGGASRAATLHKKNGEWVQKLMKKGFSPLQHKWIVRIIMGELKFGLQRDAILKHFSPYASTLYFGHNNLKFVCDKMCDPEYIAAEQAKEEERRAAKERGVVRNRWQPPSEPAVLGNLISPMLSTKTTFATCIGDAQKNHAEFLKSCPSDAPVTAALALKFPALAVELKLDGERIVAHVKNEIVTLQTRNSNWYSQLYSPVIAPAIREALKMYPKLNVILDGEILSWDDEKKRIIPFGQNRTNACVRRAYLKKTRQIDPRDIGLHDDDDERDIGQVMRVSKEKDYDDVDADAGRSCWLRYDVFDLLHVDGEDAPRLFRDAGLSQYEPGSIIHLSTIERKTLLYRLLTPVPNMVHFCETLIVRPNGTMVRDAADYFSTTDPMMEHGHSVLKLDSTQAVIAGDIDDLAAIDEQRRGGKSDAEIDELRSEALDEIYRVVVEEAKNEGILIKDLAAPYILGGPSRIRKYWHKFKPDYESGEAVDIDVVIVGACYAIGFKNSGYISEFLCAVKDEDDPTSYLTFGYVNGNVKREEIQKIKEITKFQKSQDGSEFSTGHWFQLEGSKTMPNFISSKSLQYVQDGAKETQDGWKIVRCQWRASKKAYPDLWIHPKNSVKLTLRGAELIKTNEYAAGITLRFPRIVKLRIDADDKPLEDLYTEKDLLKDYIEAIQKRNAVDQSQGKSVFHGISSSNSVFKTPRRFSTAAEYEKQKKAKRRRARKRKFGDAVVYEDPEEIKSASLKGITITVLEGAYRLDKDSLEAQEAKDQGWYDEALSIQSAQEVVKFAKSHGASFRTSANGDEDFIVGGRKTDAKVVVTMQGIENARANRVVDKTKLSKAQQRINQMATQVGILKWTFLYSIVHRWLKSQANSSVDVNEVSMKSDGSYLLDPKADDYLTYTATEEVSSINLFDPDMADTITITDMRRALQGSGLPASSDLSSVIPWQIAGMVHMAEKDRWALSTYHEALWPFKEDGGSDASRQRLCIIYPDLFQNDFGLPVMKDISSLGSDETERWDLACENDSIESTLPLAKAMGAWVSCHFHSEVTILLCELPSDIDSLSAEEALEQGGNRAVELVSHAKTIGMDLSRLRCVSPRWIREQWSTTRAT